MKKYIHLLHLELSCFSKYFKSEYHILIGIA